MSALRLRSILLALTLALGAGLLGPLPQASASASRTNQVLRAEHIALQQIGDPYRYGAAGPGSFDCSGLMYYSFRKAGISMPRTAAAQARRAHRIAKSSLRPGDLMFFTGGGGVYHAAMFLRWDHGHAVMLHAPEPGQRVRRDRPWTTHWFAATLRH